MNSLAWAGISLMGGGNGDGVWTFTNPVLSPEAGVGPQYQNAWEVSASDALSIVGGTTENYQAPFFTFHNGANGVNILGHEMHTSGDPAPPFVFQFGNSAAQPINVLLPKLVSSTGVNPALTDHPESVNQMKSSTVSAVAYSATPTFDASLATAFKMTLTGNVTSSTFSNAKNGDLLTFILCQDSTGGRSFAWPANIVGGAALNPAANQCTTQNFKHDGTYAQGGWWVHATEFSPNTQPGACGSDQRQQVRAYVVGWKSAGIDSF